MTIGSDYDITYNIQRITHTVTHTHTARGTKTNDRYTTFDSDLQFDLSQKI